MTPQPQQVTQLLIAWSNGDQAARDELMPLVYEELHRLAHLYMNRERPDHTLQTSALVNEAFIKLIDQKNVDWQNRSHFFGLAAQMMRRILKKSVPSQFHLTDVLSRRCKGIEKTTSCC